jgi:hypothetical protein
VPQLLAQHADCKLASTTATSSTAAAPATASESQQQQADVTTEQQLPDDASKVLYNSYNI